MKKRFFRLKSTRTRSTSMPRTLGVEMRKQNAPVPQVTRESECIADIVPYDENLLERSRTQWQFGDWETLAKLDRDTLQHHPDRAKLALLAAAGHQQQGNMEQTRQFTRLAQDWGCGKKLISQVLIAGVYNTLGKASAIAGQEQRALGHFEESVRTARPDTDARLFGESRIIRESVQLGLLPQAARLLDGQVNNLKTTNAPDQARIKILESEVELLHHELSLAQQKQQLFTPQLKTDTSIGSADWKEDLKKLSVSQLGQDLWVLEKTNYKREGFFVEFGATDGVLLSNTWLLEKEFGWKGICAEPNPKFFEQLKQNRDCIVSNQYIGRETGEEVEFILADVYGGSRKFADEDQHKDKRDAYADAGHLTHVTSISLDDFLEKHNAPQDIDYMSIDTEGSEYDLLSSFPFEKWNIRLFSIEHNFTEQRDKIFKLLSHHGYTRSEHEWDDWYEKGD